jgi:hypothetical protein
MCGAMAILLLPTPLSLLPTPPQRNVFIQFTCRFCLHRQYQHPRWSLSARIPNEKLKNRTILKFCSALRVCEFPFHLQLLLSILEFAPELAIPYVLNLTISLHTLPIIIISCHLLSCGCRYFESFPYAMDPRPSDKWNISVRLISRVLERCPFPPLPKDLELLDPEHISHAIFFPMKLDRKGLSHGVRHKDKEVRSNVLHLCRSLLQRLEKFQKIVGKNVWNGTSAFGEGTTMVLLQLPEPPVFLSALTPANKKKISPSMEDDSSAQDIISILSSFSRVNPSVCIFSLSSCTKMDMLTYCHINFSFLHLVSCLAIELECLVVDGFKIRLFGISHRKHCRMGSTIHSKSLSSSWQN